MGPAALTAAARAGAGHADAERALAPEVVEALRDSRQLRMLVPASLGGGEVAPDRMVAGIEELARADGAAGWCLAVAATGGVLAAFMEPEPAREVFGDARGWVAGVFAPRCSSAATATSTWPPSTCWSTPPRGSSRGGCCSGRPCARSSSSSGPSS